VSLITHTLVKNLHLSALIRGVRGIEGGKFLTFAKGRSLLVKTFNLPISTN
jgi:hypothetical protein